MIFFPWVVILPRFARGCSGHSVRIRPRIRYGGAHASVTSSTHNQRRAYIAWAVVCVVWGTTYLGIRIALETIPPLSMAALRWIAAGALLILVLEACAASGSRAPRVAGSLAVLGILLLGFGNGAVVWAEQTVPSGLTAVLVATCAVLDGRPRRADAGRRRADVPARRSASSSGSRGIVMLVWPELRMGGGRASVSRRRDRGADRLRRMGDRFDATRARPRCTKRTCWRRPRSRCCSGDRAALLPAGARGMARARVIGANGRLRLLI